MTCPCRGLLWPGNHISWILPFAGHHLAIVPMACEALPRHSQDKTHPFDAGRWLCRYRLITERIRTADWIIPPNMNATPELRSLLSRILVPDPHRRATILEITDHPWFSKGLPKGVMSMNDQCLDLKDQTAGYAQHPFMISSIRICTLATQVCLNQITFCWVYNMLQLLYGGRTHRTEVHLM